MELLDWYKEQFPWYWEESLKLVKPPYLKVEGWTEDECRYRQREDAFVTDLHNIGYMSDEHLAEIAAWFLRQLPPPPPQVGLGIEQALWMRVRAYMGPVIDQVLKSFWLWLRENVTELFSTIWGYVKAAFEKAWPPVQAQLEKWGRDAFDLTVKHLLHGGVVTPETAPGLAGTMFAAALGMGMTAHFTAVGLELVHPFKELGFGQIAGILAQFASFGPVAAATLGTVHFAALRRPMQYAVNKVTRSQLPDDQLLQIMAVKPDISMEQFIETMKYHGYSDYWIDRIKRTMFHEPRYFELKMMSEDEAATDAWLFEKSRRAGFNEADSKVMVSSYVKSATRTQRLDYYRQAFYLYKEGFITDGHFAKALDDLEYRPEAKVFSMKAARLAYLLDVTKEEISYWTDCYLKDIINSEELMVYYSVLGIVPDRIEAMVRRARVRKRKKPGQPVKTELERAMSQIQSKYSQAYVTLYRKDLIDEDQLVADLIAIGIVPELAEATVALELARKVT